MPDPKRLLESEFVDEASVLERDLLQSLSPTPGEREQVLASVLAQAGLAAAAVSGGASLATEGAATGAGLLTKIAVTACVALPLAGAGVYFAASGETERPAPLVRAASTAPRVSVAVVDEPPVRPISVASTPAASVDEKPAIKLEVSERPAVKMVAQAPPLSDLLVEDGLLRSARAAMKRGDYDDSLALLAELERRFPQGTLAQERELLRISVLKAGGKRREAKRNSDKFRDLYPDSPYDVLGEKAAKPER